MNILILNQILYTADNNVIPHIKTIKDTMIYNMCLGFKTLGHHVSLVASEDFSPTENEVYDFEVVFVKSNLKRLFKPSVLPLSFQLKTFLKENAYKYDLIISSEVFSFQSLFASLICPEKTLIWQELTEHQNRFHKLPSKIWHNVIVKLFMKKVLAVVPRSLQAYRFISKYMSTVTSIIIDHGINVDKFLCSANKKRQIVSSSQLIYRKNVDGIIKIFYKFHQLNGYEDIKLIIAGRGEEEHNLKELVKKLNLNDSVEFIGFLSHKELNEYIRDSYAFLVNTRKDLNMVSIPESIVSGTPILTNRKPASAYYIEKYYLGIVKDEWNEYDIKNIIDNNKKYVDNCINYRTNLTNTHVAQQFIDIFKSN